ncbi:MAG: hypothetical protein ACJ0SL_08645 [Candidatus Rariloculaceae bacterium]
MSNVNLLIVGVGVFGLLLIGLFLTLIEAQTGSKRPDLMVGVKPQRIVDEDELASRGSSSAASE